MGKTESLFAGVLLAAVAMAVMLLVFRGEGGTTPYNPSDRNGSFVDLGEGFDGLTGDTDQDLCTCYEKAFSYGNRQLSLESLEYRGGFSACSQRYGREGGNAWTAGWENGSSPVSGSPRTCRAYYGTARGR